jgi:hypothetical protein
VLVVKPSIVVVVEPVPSVVLELVEATTPNVLKTTLGAPMTNEGLAANPWTNALPVPKDRVSVATCSSDTLSPVGSGP